MTVEVHPAVLLSRRPPGDIDLLPGQCWYSELSPRRVSSEAVRLAEHVKEVSRLDLDLPHPIEIRWFRASTADDLVSAKLRLARGLHTFVGRRGLLGRVHEQERHTVWLYAGLDLEQLLDTTSHEVRHVFQIERRGIPRTAFEDDAEDFAVRASFWHCRHCPAPECAGFL